MGLPGVGAGPWQAMGQLPAGGAQGFEPGVLTQIVMAEFSCSIPRWSCMCWWQSRGAASKQRGTGWGTGPAAPLGHPATALVATDH